VYNVDIPKRVTKQLDKIPHKDYPSISKAIQNLKVPAPPAARNYWNPFIEFASVIIESSIGSMMPTKTS
jgi:hypothetical protein